MLHHKIDRMSDSLDETQELLLIDEDRICKFWKDSQIFPKSLLLSDKLFTFYDGPPFATGLPHYGHIGVGCIKDTIGRYQTQSGFTVPRRQGWDAHGLPIEFKMGEIFNVRTPQEIEQYTLPKYNDACRSIVMSCASDWERIINRFGRWVDFENDYKTLDLTYMNSVWWVFSQLYKKELIYSSYKVMPYSVPCSTSLSNFETQQNYKDIEDTTVIVRFKLIDNSEFLDTYLLVWTTTPWTLPSNIAIGVNPTISYSIVTYNDEKYIVSTNLISLVFKKKSITISEKTYLGIELIRLNLKYIPLFDYYPIDKLNDPSLAYTLISADYITDSNGTGLVHEAPSYGEEDYNTCITNNIITKTDKLWMSINKTGYFVENMGELSGLYYKNYPQTDTNDGNNKIISILEQSNNIFDKYKYTHSCPFCDRSKTPLMYRAIDSICIKADPSRMSELNEEINWKPQHIGKGRFKQWIKEAKDWNISRSRYWGTPIPIFVNIQDDSDVIIVESSYELEKLCHLEPNYLKDIHSDKINDLVINKSGKIYKWKPIVFDCWFESGCMPYASVGYPFNTKDLPPPADFIVEGLDQTRGWFYALLFISTVLLDRIPFKNVIVSGLILASDGKKMSKSLKNYPDPMEIINKYGSDALRLYLLSSSLSNAEPVLFNESDVKLMVKDVIIRLKHAIKFYKEYEEMFMLKNPDDKLFDNTNISTTNILDLYAIYEIGAKIDDINDFLKKYEITNATNRILQIVELLNNVYIKYNRHALKGQNLHWKSSLSTLGLILRKLMVNIAPIIPFFAEYMFELLKITTHESVHLVLFTNKYYQLPHLSAEECVLGNKMNHVLNIIKQILIIRSKHNISMKTPIDNIIIKTSLEINDTDIKVLLDELNILKVQIEVFDWDNIQIELRPNYKIIKQTYSNIQLVKSIIQQISSDQMLSRELVINNKVSINDITITSDMVDIIIKPLTIDDYVCEYVFNDGHNYCVYASTIETDKIKELVYTKVIASEFQQMRKKAGLHPWNPVKLGILGDTEYDFEKIKYEIEKTCSIMPIKLDIIPLELIYTSNIFEEPFTLSLYLF